VVVKYINVAGDIFLRPPDETETNDDVDFGLNGDHDHRKMFKVRNFYLAIFCKFKTTFGKTRASIYHRWGIPSYGYS
jgi:hypothetical protein